MRRVVVGMTDEMLAAVEAYESEDCPICGRMQTLHLALTWQKEDWEDGGWDALQWCSACRHIVTPGDTWWEDKAT